MLTQLVLYPVLSNPAAMPLTVVPMENLSWTALTLCCLRRSSSTGTKLMGTTYRMIASERYYSIGRLNEEPLRTVSILPISLLESPYLELAQGKGCTAGSCSDGSHIPARDRPFVLPEYSH
jgi:hypothetical protein